MNRKRSQRFVFGLILVALFSASCSVPATPTPIPPTTAPPATTAPALPTATSVPPTAAPQPTATRVPPTSTSAPPTATRFPPTPTVTSSPAPLAALDGVFFREVAISSGKRFDFLRFWADGNVASNSAVAVDAQAAWNAVRASLVPGNQNIATGKYTLKGKEVAFALSVLGQAALGYTGTVEGDKMTLTEKVVRSGQVSQNVLFTRADFAR